MSKIHVLSLLVTGALGLAVLGADARSPARSYVVVYDAHASAASARSAVKSSGGAIVRENMKVGVATAFSRNPSFLAAASRQRAIFGAAVDRPVGSTLEAPRSRSDDALAKARAAREGAAGPSVANGPAPAAEPLAGAAVGHGDDPRHRRRLVPEAAGRPAACSSASLDTGIDGTHPDIAPNFDAALSRNFTTDIPLVDGPCEDEPDASCNDPANVDEDGHGTHVAGTIAAPLNGLGIAGVAPNVTLVNIRAGPGLRLLLPAAVGRRAHVRRRHRGRRRQHELLHRPVALQLRRTTRPTRRTQQLEQRTIIEATNRALNYARQPRRHADRGRGQRAHRPRQPDDRRDQPGLPAGHRVHRGSSTTRA